MYHAHLITVIYMPYDSIFRQTPQSDSLKPDVVMHTLFLIAIAALLLLLPRMATTESSRPARTTLVMVVGEHSKCYLTTAYYRRHTDA